MMNIMIAGLTGAGKTTHARLLASEFQLRYISGSAIRLKHVNPEQDYASPTFWRMSSDAVALDNQRLKQPDADLAADEEMRRMSVAEDGLVFDVWPLPWLSDSAVLRILLECPLENRARRVLSTLPEGTSTIAEIEKRIAEKDERARQFFALNYGFDLFTDRRPFNVILDTSHLTTGAACHTYERSITAVHEILGALVIWYSGDRQRGRHLFNVCLEKYPGEIFLRYPASVVEIDRS